MVIKKRSFRPTVFLSFGGGPKPKQSSTATTTSTLRSLKAPQESNSSQLSTEDATHHHHHHDGFQQDDEFLYSTRDAPSSHSPRKDVRFNERVQVIEFYRGNRTCDDLWYTAPDYQRFQQAKSLLARGVIKSMPHYVKALKLTYQACCQNRSPLQPHNNLAVMDGNKDTAALVHVLEPDLLGLEDVCLADTIRSDDKRQKILKAVQSQQSNVDRLRKTCETLSRPSRLFAQQLGKAWAQID